MADGGRFRGLASGARRSAGGFRIGPEETGLAEGASLLAESAIDAVSALSLCVGGRVRLHASTAGVCRRLPDRLCDADRVEIVCGLDADAAGDVAAAALAASDRRLRRARPSGAKDWLALLPRDGLWAWTGGLPACGC